MTYRIDVAPAAARELRKLDPPARRRIQAAIEILADVPRPPAAKPLVASGGAWRVRVGDYRIVYDIEDDRLVILVLRVAHRREVYRDFV
ncbi:type II toxin-antitoxin system RelE family toxin [Leifsonia shinshuensis]|uniref:Type II toxin-antitoxin system RelE/ParE family toxin n=1 Tax=Leifsonia shinshuensis TaxID=150026 RepID=A0A7G6YE67_9MICO|nr:type II toxin-antitoxin system RelE/ParE family toxin [Leifsonia shinshuensis]QNE36782.1 type II toxin-antitoxin system RelE/ParE family toxin [Leifsonia shinshuensis]